jgi:hypothetical protein
MRWCRRSHLAAPLAASPTQSARPASTTSLLFSVVRRGLAQPQVCHVLIVQLEPASVMCALDSVSLVADARGLDFKASMASAVQCMLCVCPEYRLVTCWHTTTTGLQAYETVIRLQSAADEVSGLSGFTFSTANRATRGFQLLGGMFAQAQRYITISNCARFTTGFGWHATAVLMSSSLHPLNLNLTPHRVAQFMGW